MLLAKGDSYGVYGTWLPGNGFYLDASYRAMSFDVTLHSRGGEVRGSGKAYAFNIEAGYAWSLAGMLIEPQFQYTRTTVNDVHALDGALADFQSEGGDSSRARLSVMMRKTFGESGTAWTPYFGVSAVREFDGSSAFAINGDFTGTTSVEGTSALVESGVTVRRGKLSVFGGLNWQEAGQGYTRTGSPAANLWFPEHRRMPQDFPFLSWRKFFEASWNP